ncbi:MAG: hypothetical protein HC902_11770 [Calothrix sp. SM1_5_4]|nr:hypothetical protein [Calothrix sp. SM1_5_4]
MELKCLKYETVEIGQSPDRRIGILRLSRPEALNALNKQLLTEMKWLVAELDSKRDIRALILTGDGEKSFVAGADIKEMETLSPSQAREMALSGQGVFSKLEELPFPVICAMNGFALGGGLELALSCDFIIASSKAKWGLPEVSLGLIPGYGGTQRLSRNIGRTLAKECLERRDLQRPTRLRMGPDRASRGARGAYADGNQAGRDSGVARAQGHGVGQGGDLVRTRQVFARGLEA